MSSRPRSRRAARCRKLRSRSTLTPTPCCQELSILLSITTLQRALGAPMSGGISPSRSLAMAEWMTTTSCRRQSPVRALLPPFRRWVQRRLRIPTTYKGRAVEGGRWLAARVGAIRPCAALGGLPKEAWHALGGVGCRGVRGDGQLRRGADGRRCGCAGSFAGSRPAVDIGADATPQGTRQPTYRGAHGCLAECAWAEPVSAP